MFGKKSSTKEVSSLPGPSAVSTSVQKYLETEKKVDPETAALLKSVIKRSTDGHGPISIRIFDEADVLARKLKVKDYSTLDEHPELVLFEGTVDEASKTVKMEEKKPLSKQPPILSEAEIRSAIEALKEPGSTVFFYMAAGSTHGGPLGMGAAVIELNPQYPEKKQKKYNIYTADVVDERPVDKGQKLFSTDKPKEVASWVKNCHHKRTYSA